MEPILTSDGSSTFLSRRYQQTYHSTHGAVAEARHVFLQASGVAGRLAGGQPCKILEVGFGLGLNYLLSADLAHSMKTALEYEAWEHDPISKTRMLTLDYALQLTNPDIATALTSQWPEPAHQTAQEPPLSPSEPFILSNPKVANSHLKVHFNDFSVAQLPDTHFDAAYLDAFSPDVNAECWTPTIFARLHAALKPGGKLATYCAKGVVRRAMQECGFTVQRIAGPTGKREILVAEA